jgi:uncharacterized protein YndB with AHSA1/START domain
MDDAVATREIAISRVFDAPRELVWKAWTEPAQLARWWGKRGWSTPLASITMDVRPGGTFRLLHVNDEDGSEMAMDTVYREVVEPGRLAWGEDGGRRATVTFTDLGDGTTRVDLHTTIQGSEALRCQAEGGLSSSWDRLAEHLGG